MSRSALDWTRSDHRDQPTNPARARAGSNPPHAAVETVFPARRRLIDRNPRFHTKNVSNCQDLTYPVPLKGKDGGVLAFQFREFVSGVGCVAGEKMTDHKRHIGSETYKTAA